MLESWQNTENAKEALQHISTFIYFPEYLQSREQQYWKCLWSYSLGKYDKYFQQQTIDFACVIWHLNLYSYNKGENKETEKNCNFRLIWLRAQWVKVCRLKYFLIEGKNSICYAKNEPKLIQVFSLAPFYLYWCFCWGWFCWLYVDFWLRISCETCWYA